MRDVTVSVRFARRRSTLYHPNEPNRIASPNLPEQRIEVNDESGADGFPKISRRLKHSIKMDDPKRESIESARKQCASPSQV